MPGSSGGGGARRPLYDERIGGDRRRPDLSGGRRWTHRYTIDTVKPKSTTELDRRTNLDRDANATLLCEHWNAADWSHLWWVRARLIRVPVHQVVEYESALRTKYPQYRTVAFAAVLVFEVRNVSGWSAAG